MDLDQWLADLTATLCEVAILLLVAATLDAAKVDEETRQ